MRPVARLLGELLGPVLLPAKAHKPKPKKRCDKKTIRPNLSRSLARLFGSRR